MDLRDGEVQRVTGENSQWHKGHGGWGVGVGVAEMRKSAAGNTLGHCHSLSQWVVNCDFNRHSIRFTYFTFCTCIGQDRCPTKSITASFFFQRQKDWVENGSGKVKSFLVDVTDDSVCNYCHNSATTVLREGEILFRFMD